MTAYEQLQSEVAYGWCKLHGRAGAYIFRPVSPIGCIIYTLKLFLQNNPNRKVGIVVKDRQQADDIRRAVNETFKDHFIDVQFIGYVRDILFLNYELMITINIYDYKQLKTVVEGNKFKYYLSIFDKREISDKDTLIREALIPFINISVPTNKIVEDYIHLPVEEHLIGVTLPDEVFANYKKCDDYVRESMKIFGNFETLDRCRIGNARMNISATAVCNAVAERNGWSYDLDTSTEFGEEIDKTYNPNVLRDRAANTYNFIRNRKNIVFNAKDKLKEIAEIVTLNMDKKIVIVSNTGEFAHEVAEYLNKMISIPDTEEYVRICGEYHDGIPDCVYKDKKGNTVTYRSGEKKGEPKIIGWRKQSTLAENDFNLNDINVMSIKSASSVDLTIDCDIIIRTSPFAGSVYDIKRRFSNTIFRSNPLQVYTLYCINTIEEKEANKIESTPIYNVIKDNEDIFVSDY